MDDVLRELRDLQCAADVLARRFQAAAEAGGELFSGTDDALAVEVSVTGAGVPAGVRVHPQWRERVRFDDLGAAIVAASGAAVTARLAAWGTGMAEQDARPAPDPPGGVAGWEPGDPASRQSQLAMEDLQALVEKVDRLLPAATAAARAAATSPVTGHDRARTVRVTQAGGLPAGVELDARWLATAPHDRIGAAVAEALADADRRGRALRDGASGGDPAFDRLRRLTESPENLLREVGLIR